MPANPAQRDELLCLFVLDKALYELNYELNNRPDWLRIPVFGILRLLGVTTPCAAVFGAVPSHGGVTFRVWAPRPRGSSCGCTTGRPRARIRSPAPMTGSTRPG